MGNKMCFVLLTCWVLRSLELWPLLVWLVHNLKTGSRLFCTLTCESFQSSQNVRYYFWGDGEAVVYIQSPIFGVWLHTHSGWTMWRCMFIFCDFLTWSARFPLATDAVTCSVCMVREWISRLWHSSRTSTILLFYCLASWDLRSVVIQCPQTEI